MRNGAVLPRAWRSSRIVMTSVLLLFLVGCGEPSERGKRTQAAAVDSGSAASRDALTALYTSNEWLFSPSHDDSPKFLMFLPLVDPATGPGGYPAVVAREGPACRWRTGGLAESWEHSPDYRTWTVRLRDGLRWHDGEPVTSRDVEFTVDLWKHPEVGHYAAAGLDSAVALDDRPFHFTLLAADRNRRAAVLIQDALRRVGVRAEIRLLDRSLLEDRMAGGSFEAGIQRVAGLEHLGHKYLFRESRLGPMPSRIAELAEAADQEPDQARREPMYAELAESFRSDLPATWLYPRTGALVARHEVHGLELPGGGLRPGWRWPFGGVEYLWIE